MRAQGLWLAAPTNSTCSALRSSEASQREAAAQREAGHDPTRHTVTARLWCGSRTRQERCPGVQSQYWSAAGQALAALQEDNIKALFFLPLERIVKFVLTGQPWAYSHLGTLTPLLNTAGYLGVGQSPRGDKALLPFAFSTSISLLSASVPGAA